MWAISIDVWETLGTVVAVACPPTSPAGGCRCATTVAWPTSRANGRETRRSYRARRPRGWEEPGMSAVETVTTTTAPRPRRGRWIDDWRPEDPAFWAATGAGVARRNLIFSIFA